MGSVLKGCDLEKVKAEVEVLVLEPVVTVF